MFFEAAIKGSALDNLDRGVVLAALGGMAVNIYEQTLFGFLLTFLAAIIYTIIRNRVQNLDQFGEDELNIPGTPIPNLKFYGVLCQWFASKELYYGLLDDLCENCIQLKNNNLTRHLQKVFVKMVFFRIGLKLLSLFGLDRLVN